MALSLFKSRSFNVKLVKDPDAPETDPQQNIQTAQAYAEIVTDAAGQVATMAVVIIAVKGVFDVARILAQAATK